MAGANSNIQITELDFNSIKTNLKTYLQSQDVLKDYNYEGSALSTLLDILAYNTQYNAYYLNMVANEMFLDTSLQRSSVVSYAKALNYTPKSAISPTAFINLTVNQVSDSSLTLPKFTNFMSEAIDGVNYNFVTVESKTVNVSSNTAVFSDVELKQGIPTTSKFTVDSATNPKYMFEIPESNVDTTTLGVVVQQSSSNSYSRIYNKATDFLSLDDCCAGAVGVGAAGAGACATNCTGAAGAAAGAAVEVGAAITLSTVVLPVAERKRRAAQRREDEASASRDVEVGFSDR